MADLHRPRAILVTGGAGFIGSSLVRYFLDSDSEARVINLDKLTYAGSLANLEGVADRHGSRYRFVRGDICDRAAVVALFADAAIDTVIHLAAETHVDRSITGPEAFLTTNIMGTYTLLQAAREVWGDRRDVRFHHVSTDEVFGSLGDSGHFTETSPYDPSSPYSSSKAASDHLVRAWHRTYDVPVTMSNCSNNYGPRQFPEKLIPLMIDKALRGEPLPVYGDGRHVRDWLHVDDHCAAIERIVRHAIPGALYVVGGDNEIPNLTLVQLLCDKLQLARPRARGHYRDLITFVGDRGGHDRRYAIDASRIRRDLGWRPRYEFSGGLEHTIGWYLANDAWSHEIRTERYAGERLGVG